MYTVIVSMRSIFRITTFHDVYIIFIIVWPILRSRHGSLLSYGFRQEKGRSSLMKQTVFTDGHEVATQNAKQRRHD